MSKRQFTVTVDPSRLATFEKFDRFMEMVRKEASDLVVDLRHTATVRIIIAIEDGRAP